MSSRGAALPTVLALVSVVLVMGLAMGSMSALSLQFNRKQLHGLRSEMAARSGLAHFLAKVREYEAQLPEDKQLNPLKPAPFEVTELLAEGIQIEENGYEVSLHFDHRLEGYSTDNSTGEEAVLGWPDFDKIERVPPFSMDLVFEVKQGDNKLYYRATLERVWPFAVYSAVGPVVLMGNAEDAGGPGGASPSTVIGSIYTQWRSQEAGGGSQVVGYGLGPLDQPSKLLANVEARQGYHPQRRVTDAPLNIGMTLGKNPEQEPDIATASDDETIYYSYSDAQVPYDLSGEESSPTFNVPSLGINDGGNSLVGNFVIDYDADQEIRPILYPAADPNLFEGDVSVRRGLALDPLYYYRADKADAEREFDSSNFTQVNLDLPDSSLENEFSPVNPVYDNPKPYLLEETLVLRPDHNSRGGATSPHYRINGSVSNRQVIFSEQSESRLCVRENFAGLELQDVVLHVKGDLDLGAKQFEEPIRILGAGATLIVDGQLVLGNAHFDSVDNGFVIFAEDIVLTGSGEFRGLMIASNSISILSRDEDDPLIINGALMCGGFGGVFLRGTQVKHDPYYLKGVNGGGDFFLASWQKFSR